METANDLLLTKDKVRVERQTTADGTPILKFIGTVDQPSPGEFLDPLFESFHADMIAAGTPHVLADLTELVFMNSSGIKALIKWIMLLQAVSAESRYAIEFLYSPKITWQPINLKAITTMAKGSVTATPAS